MAWVWCTLATSIPKVCSTSVSSRQVIPQSSSWWELFWFSTHWPWSQLLNWTHFPLSPGTVFAYRNTGQTRIWFIEPLCHFTCLVSLTLCLQICNKWRWSPTLYELCSLLAGMWSTQNFWPNRSFADCWRCGATHILMQSVHACSFSWTWCPWNEAFSPGCWDGW